MDADESDNNDLHVMTKDVDFSNRFQSDNSASKSHVVKIVFAMVKVYCVVHVSLNFPQPSFLSPKNLYFSGRSGEGMVLCRIADLFCLAKCMPNLYVMSTFTKFLTVALCRYLWIMHSSLKCSIRIN